MKSSITGASTAIVGMSMAARRFVAEADRSHPRAVQVIPGGESGNPNGPFFANQLGLWLTNDAHPALQTRNAVEQNAASQQVFLPSR